MPQSTGSNLTITSSPFWPLTLFRDLFPFPSIFFFLLFSVGGWKDRRKRVEKGERKRAHKVAKRPGLVFKSGSSSKTMPLKGVFWPLPLPVLPLSFQEAMKWAASAPCFQSFLPLGPKQHKPKSAFLPCGCYSHFSLLVITETKILTNTVSYCFKTLNNIFLWTDYIFISAYMLSTERGIFFLCRGRKVFSNSFAQYQQFMICLPKNSFKH